MSCKCVNFKAVLQSRRVELVTRFDYIWQTQAEEEKVETENRRRLNRALLENLLPRHVADHFLKEQASSCELYHEQQENAAILFATITGFSQFYVELDANNEGVECLRLLNELIVDFDELLDREEFRGIEKIKTISATYMAASGLFGKVEGTGHVAQLARFAIALMASLQQSNEHSFNNFELRVGLNCGPVVAGVIGGAFKPHYDIWGNTVNIASRMDSTGCPGKIQVTEETKRVLEAEGFLFDCRGSINVKGVEGEVMTYFLKTDSDLKYA